MKQLSGICDLCLFRHAVRQYLSEEEFNQLYKGSIQLRFKRGENILKQGNKFTHIVNLYKGKVKFNFENRTGKNLILNVANAPILLGSANLFSGDLNMFSITAIEDCEVCLIDTAILKKLVHQNSELAIRLIEFVTSMFKNSIMNSISMAHKQVNGRIAEVLLYLSLKVYKNTHFTLTLTRKELSEFVGCSQENIINTLSRLHKEGIIKLDGKEIEILKRDKLEEICRLG